MRGGSIKPQLDRVASVSLDLDDYWTYLKVRGNPAWTEFPTYLDIVVPRVLRFLEARSMRITFFVVGQDAAFSRNAPLLRAIAQAGHEIGNHSFHHEPWLHLYSAAEIQSEIASAEDYITNATGRAVRGFRGPGFSISDAVAEVLASRGYIYDASTLPTFIGPLARAYYLLTARMDRAERARRGALFGRWRDGFRRLKPYQWQTRSQPLLEIPVSTVPLLRTPFHLRYLIWLAGYSDRLARSYLNLALTLCRASGVGPSFLLHPLDFLELSEAPELGFFPGMRVSLQQKLELAGFALARISAQYRILPLEQHAALASPVQSAVAREYDTAMGTSIKENPLG
jgi:peptidoglycan-N-acetylglucosamine deacetylase